MKEYLSICGPGYNYLIPSHLSCTAVPCEDPFAPIHDDEPPYRENQFQIDFSKCRGETSDIDYESLKKFREIQARQDFDYEVYCGEGYEY